LTSSKIEVIFDFLAGSRNTDTLFYSPEIEHGGDPILFTWNWTWRRRSKKIL